MPIFVLVPISALPDLPPGPGIDIDDHYAVRRGNVTYRETRMAMTTTLITQIYGTEVIVVRAATVGALPASTYNNGAAGVGATLTADANGAFPTLAGMTGAFLVGEYVLVKNQSLNKENGVYEVTDLGSAGTPWILTRIADADATSEMQEQLVASEEGSAKGLYAQVTDSPVIGTDKIEYVLLQGYPGVIHVTLLQAQAHITNGTVKHGRTYLITDVGDDGIYIQGQGKFGFNPIGHGSFFVADWLGVSAQMLKASSYGYCMWDTDTSAWWNDITVTQGINPLNKICIYKGTHYRNLTGNNTAVDPASDAVNWEELPRSTANHYIRESHWVKYDVPNGFFLTRGCHRGHEIHNSQSLGTQNIERFQWGNDGWLNIKVDGTSSFEADTFRGLIFTGEIAINSTLVLNSTQPSRDGVTYTNLVIRDSSLTLDTFGSRNISNLRVDGIVGSETYNLDEDIGSSVPVIITHERSTLVGVMTLSIGGEFPGVLDSTLFAFGEFIVSCAIANPVSASGMGLLPIRGLSTNGVSGRIRIRPDAAITAWQIDHDNTPGGVLVPGGGAITLDGSKGDWIDVTIAPSWMAADYQIVDYRNY